MIAEMVSFTAQYFVSVAKKWFSHSLDHNRTFFDRARNIRSWGKIRRNRGESGL